MPGLPGPCALILDFGGVLTTPVADSYRAFCEAEGIDPQVFRRVIRRAYRDPDPQDPVVQFELGLIDPETFNRKLAAALEEGLGRPVRPEGLASRILGSTAPEPRMAEAVRRARGAGVRTALLSNSWGRTDYPAELLALFDAVLISAEVGVRKPDPRAFELAARRLGVTPPQCVVVDDARPNCEAAEALGMHAILHRDPQTTIPQLEALLGVTLR